MNRKDLIFISAFLIGITLIIGIGYIYLFLNLISPNSHQNPPYYNIFIYSDAKFEEYGFPGNGSKENPYRIENYSFSTAIYDGIRIDNVTKYFVIQNNEISAGRYGICIYSVSANITRIENNVIHGCATGIMIFYAQGSHVLNNTLYNNGADIYMDSFTNEYCSLNSSFSVIANNTCYRDNGTSIINSGNKGVLIENNSIFLTKKKSFRAALGLYSPINNTIRNNYFENGGFDIYFNDYSKWVSLKMYDNYLNGEYFNYKFLVNEKGMAINVSEFHQINMFNCTDIELFGGVFKLVNMGLNLRNCSNILIDECVFTEMGGIGAELVNTWNVSFIGNFFSNSYEGFRAYTSKNILALNCSFMNCRNGVQFLYSDAFLRNSTLKGNKIGCVLFDCGYEPSAKIDGIPIDYNCTITGNKFINNSIGCFAYVSICIIRNNLFQLNHNGLYLRGWDAIAYITKTKSHLIENKFTENDICVKMKLSESHLSDNYFGFSNYGVYYSSDSLYWLNGDIFEHTDVNIYQAPDDVNFPIPL